VPVMATVNKAAVVVTAVLRKTLGAIFGLGT
jgi:hypothetical protein